MTTRQWRLAPETSLLRRSAAGMLRGSSRLLSRLARQLATHRGSQQAAALPMYEFHAEAGAPEGALYVDGVLVGHLTGVTRL